MPLNDNTNWGDVGATKTGASSTVGDAFKGKHADRVELPGAMKLYKFNDFSTPTAPNSKALSPWWSPYDDYRHDGGWEQRKKLAEHLGVSILEFGRLTSAVKENWNSLQYLLVITLSKPVIAYFGGFAQMPRIDEGQASKKHASEGVGATKLGATQKRNNPTATVNLPGGGTQFYIPNLTTDEISGWVVESLIPTKK